MKIVAAALLAGSAAAANRPMKGNSKAVRGLLAKARRVDGGDSKADGAVTAARRLDDEMGSWAASYSLYFEKCHVSEQYFNYGNNDNNNRGMYGQRLVQFKLCPSNACGYGCSGPDYVVDMFEFLEAWVQYQQEAMEKQCECAKENCYCNDDDEEACEAQCYQNAGIYEYCVDEDENNDNNGNDNGQQQEEIELEEAVQCANLDVDEDAMAYYYYNAQQNGDGNNNNYYYNNNGNMEFFVGPYCSSDGYSIHLGVFMEESCSVTAPSGIYEQTHYGQALPYSTVSIVSSECISCLDEDDENACYQNQNQNYNNGGGDDDANAYYYYNNNGDEPEVNELCGRLYEDAGKCEADLEAQYGYYPNTWACDFIESLSASKKSITVTETTTSVTDKFSGINVTPRVLAGVFGATTAFFAVMAFYYRTKLSRADVGLGAGLVRGKGDLA